MLSLVLPERCIHCDSAAEKSAVLRTHVSREPRKLLRYLCGECLRMFDRLPIPESAQIKEQLNTFFPIDESVHCLAHRTFMQNGIVQSVIHAFKYHDMPRLARAVGREIGREVANNRREDSSKFDLIVPVPLHRTRLAERGYNQSEEIAIGLGREWNVAVLGDKMIRRVRPTRSQASLSIPERRENVEGAFRLTKSGYQTLQGKRLLIIDDVLTTGSTIGSVASELQHANPASISFAVFATAVSADG